MSNFVAKSLSALPEFIFIGEHPALDFINTRFAPQGELIDLLRTWPDVLRWLEKAELKTEASLHLSSVRAETALRRVLELREEWREQIRRLESGRAVNAAFLSELNRLLAPRNFFEAVERSGESYEIVRRPLPVDPEDLALALIAGQVAGFLAGGDPAHLHKCADAACVLHFYDTTKNHRRQWCSAAMCGNRHKVAAFRERRRSQTK